MSPTDAFADAPILGRPRIATDTALHLAEGPLWDPLRGELLWVDILAGAVFRGRLESDGTISTEERVQFPGTAGAVAVSAAGDWVVAGTDRLLFRGADGSIRQGPQLVEGAERRFNDGKPDPAGRFVVGTKGPTNHEQLLRIDADGRVDVLDDDLMLSNGLAWTRDGRRMYSIDTPTRRIHVRDYDPVTGASGPRSVFLELVDGFPDGMTTDTEDHLWVAIWGGGCVIRIAPTGEIVGRIEVPAPHTSCPVFAGPDLDTLVITTAREDLAPEQLAEHPLSGRLFTVRTGHRGNPPSFWAGYAGPEQPVPGPR